VSLVFDSRLRRGFFWVLTFLVTQLFWSSHNPTASSRPQYMSALFVHTPEQHAAAQASKAEHQRNLRAAIVTRIVPATDFYLAEHYHQKYQLRCDDSLLAFLKPYSPCQLRDSILASRLNALAGGATVRPADLEAALADARRSGAFAVMSASEFESVCDAIRSRAPASGRSSGGGFCRW
jgi:hypothetical protein